MTPKVQLVAHESRNPAKIFVAIPDQRGRYLLSDRSVAMVACSHCGSIIGEPCKGRQGYCGGTHYVRRIAAKFISPKPHAPDVMEGDITIDGTDWPVLEKI